MNAKIFVGAAVGALAVIIGIIAFSGLLEIDVSEEGTLLEPTDNTTNQVLPLDIELDDISILEVTETVATIQISFKISNPNSKSILLHLLNYKLYENDVRISTGNIGERPGGMVIGSNYFIIFNEQPTILKDRITIKNTGNNPEFWSALENDTVEWKVKGEAFFNLSSMTSGVRRRSRLPRFGASLAPLSRSRRSPPQGSGQSAGPATRSFPASRP